MLLRLVLLAVLAYAAVCAGLYVFQRRLIYHGGGPRPVAPEGVEVRGLRTQDGLELLAWYLKPGKPQAPVVLFLHGNAGDLANRIPRLQALSHEGWGALLVEYRGFGGNPGTPDEQGVYADARAGYDALREWGVPPARIVIWGESLGTGVASDLAAGHAAAALVLESPFTSITDMAWRSYPVVPVNLLLKDRFDTLSRIGAIRMPLLIVNGARDRLVPPEMGARLLAASGSAVKRLVTLPDSGHNEMMEHGVMPTAIAFIRQLFPGS